MGQGSARDPTFALLSKNQARRQWEAQIAVTAATYTSKPHLLTGALLPIWDGLPDGPRFVRAHTVGGERRMARVVSNATLDQTLNASGVAQVRTSWRRPRCSSA